MPVINNLESFRFQKICIFNIILKNMMKNLKNTV